MKQFIKRCSNSSQPSDDCFESFLTKIQLLPDSLQYIVGKIKQPYIVT